MPYAKDLEASLNPPLVTVEDFLEMARLWPNTVRLTNAEETCEVLDHGAVYLPEPYDYLGE